MTKPAGKVDWIVLGGIVAVSAGDLACRFTGVYSRSVSNHVQFFLFAGCIVLGAIVGLWSGLRDE